MTNDLMTNDLAPERECAPLGAGGAALVQHQEVPLPGNGLVYCVLADDSTFPAFAGTVGRARNDVRYIVSFVGCGNMDLPIGIDGQVFP